MTQLDLFPVDQYNFLVQKLEETRSLTENVRRGLFARYNTLERDVLELQEKIRNLPKTGS